MKLTPDIPYEVPLHGNSLTRFIGRVFLRLLGWRVTGEVPNIKKCLVAAAPHTSNWDFIVAMPARLALGIKISFLMKKEAFFWPCEGLFKSLGGIPTDRSVPGGVVGQIAEAYSNQEQLWVGITPEGTRSKVDKWKNGFLRIAHQAQVPVLLVGWDYPSKTIRLGKLYQPTGDIDADMQSIYDYYQNNFTGRRPERQ